MGNDNGISTEEEDKKTLSVKKDGVSLRKTFAFMLPVSLVVTGLLLAATFFTFRVYYFLSGATDDYIILSESAAGLLQASDYLTEEVQSYSVTGDRVHLDNYFYEAKNINTDHLLGSFPFVLLRFHKILDRFLSRNKIILNHQEYRLNIQ